MLVLDEYDEMLLPASFASRESASRRQLAATLLFFVSEVRLSMLRILFVVLLLRAVLLVEWVLSALLSELGEATVLSDSLGRWM